MKKFLAFVVDITISFFGLGYIIALITGETVQNGFKLQGMSAIVLFTLIILYFVLSKKFLGQTPGRKLFKVSK